MRAIIQIVLNENADRLVNIRRGELDLYIRGDYHEILDFIKEISDTVWRLARKNGCTKTQGFQESLTSPAQSPDPPRPSTDSPKSD